ncbi:DUF4221 family protein [Pseudoflavitalea sp. X16]|uniref:DUF4221 family protein n=1 Tax=Paraflavitalea devenefica TaxID=2716334 RepID=UPI0014206AF4|nr:DUF4221 family protein [Paraflavitalea devenefica]NII29862.1 DUF4221 family protein [Paraflavitalea devenefica]
MKLCPPSGNPRFFHVATIAFSLWLVGCRQLPTPQYQYQAPTYRHISLVPTADTLHFTLRSDSYNSVRSFNYYMDQGIEYIAFYDKISGAVCIYNFRTGQLTTKIKLKHLLPYRGLSKKTTVYIKNADSIYVINKDMVYRFNRSLVLQDSISFQPNPFPALASFRPEAPPFFHDGKLYLKASPILSAKKKKDYRKWKSLYELDFTSKHSMLLYAPPARYQDSLYGFFFFATSYCINDKNRLVFSYAADSNLYETDLAGYHMAYNGKSKFQQGDIPAVREEERTAEDAMKTAFNKRDSYENIYFDPVQKRYLRVAEQRIQERDFLLGKKSKNKSLIFFDQELRIIGECNLAGNFSLSTLFFTADGQMYVRTRASDQYSIHLLRLAYQEDTTATHLAKVP